MIQLQWKNKSICKHKARCEAYEHEDTICNYGDEFAKNCNLYIKFENGTINEFKISSIIGINGLN